MGSKIKYMGSSHVHYLDKGENFGERLATPLAKRVEWNLENGHLVDADQVGLSAEAVKLLTEAPSEFKDVTGMERVPTSLGQQIWQGAKKSEYDAQGDVPALDQDTVPKPDDEVVVAKPRTR
jgi:hypothetical protein